MRRIVGGIAVLVAAAVLVQCSEDGTGPDEPAIALSTQSVAVTGFAGEEAPAPAEVAVSSGGGGSLTGLAATVAYGAGQPTGWLAATLSADSTPAVLTIAASTVGLPAALYTATVTVGSDVADVIPQPVDVAFVVADPQATWAGLPAGTGGTCGLMTVGAAFCWGASESGQIGDGTTRRTTIPTAVLGGRTFAALTVGAAHTCGLTAAGSAWCWGANAAGQLGDGSTANRFVPTEVTGGVVFTSLFAGDRHTCGLTAQGEAYCWGSNEYGQLGDGTAVDRRQPTAVAGGLTFALLSGGGAHTCGLTNGGDAYCWGDNQFGALGDGTTANRRQPTAVGGTVTLLGLTAGAEHTCGWDANGAAFCWGRNDRGQLGDGTTAGTARTPAPVAGGLSFAVVVTGVGSAHTCGLTPAGAAYCWGANADGQVGDGSVASRLSPTAVSGGLVFTDLSVGGSHSCGVTSAGGTGYCWGANGMGQVGDGTLANRFSPVGIANP